MCPQVFQCCSFPQAHACSICADFRVWKVFLVLYCKVYYCLLICFVAFEKRELERIAGCVLGTGVGIVYCASLILSLHRWMYNATQASWDLKRCAVCCDTETSTFTWVAGLLCAFLPLHYYSMVDFLRALFLCILTVTGSFNVS